MTNARLSAGDSQQRVDRTVRIGREDFVEYRSVSITSSDNKFIGNQCFSGE